MEDEIIISESVLYIFLLTYDPHVRLSVGLVVRRSVYYTYSKYSDMALAMINFTSMQI